MHFIANEIVVKTVHEQVDAANVSCFRSIALNVSIRNFILVCGYIFIMSRSYFSVKVIGTKSRSYARDLIHSRRWSAFDYKAFLFFVFNW